MARSIEILLVVLLLSGCASAPVYECEEITRQGKCYGYEPFVDDSGTVWAGIGVCDSKKITICTPQKGTKDRLFLKTSGNTDDVSWKIDDAEIEALTTDKVLE